MPNWCNNTLNISGDKKVISRIKDWYEQNQSNKTELGLFGLFYPMPKELENTTAPSPEPNKALIEKYGADNWYQWHLANWGTKWDTNEICMVGETENEIRLSFDTPWSPPTQFYEKLIKDYSGIQINASYYEGGMDFCGTWDSDFGEEDFSISEIKQKCLSIYVRTHKKCKEFVDGFEFRKRLEDIYINNFSISKDIDVCNIFDDYYFEENLSDAKFCELWKIKESQ